MRKDWITRSHLHSLTLSASSMKQKHLYIYIFIYIYSLCHHNIDSLCVRARLQKHRKKISQSIGEGKFLGLDKAEKKKDRGGKVFLTGEQLQLKTSLNYFGIIVLLEHQFQSVALTITAFEPDLQRHVPGARRSCK